MLFLSGGERFGDRLFDLGRIGSLYGNLDRPVFQLADLLRLPVVYLLEPDSSFPLLIQR